MSHVNNIKNSKVICAKCNVQINNNDLVGIYLPPEDYDVHNQVLPLEGYNGYYLACKDCVSIHSYIGRLGPNNQLVDQDAVIQLDLESIVA